MEKARGEAGRRKQRGRRRTIEGERG